MKMKMKNVALIGGRGAGKSKVSRRLSKLTGWPVMSTDILVAYEAGGLSVEKIVAKEGWSGFRAREFAILEKLKLMQEVIIDCGGGILVEAPAADGSAGETFSKRKSELLRSYATLVYIKRPMSWLLEKARKDSNRPDLVGNYVELLERRLPWYEQAADQILDLGDGAAADGAETLRDRLGLPRHQSA